MITELNRMITWIKHYGIAQEEIFDLLCGLTGGDVPLAEEEDIQSLEANLRTIEPDPLKRAKLACGFLQIEPAEEAESEVIAEATQFLPILLSAIREIVETRPRETALEELATLL